MSKWLLNLLDKTGKFVRLNDISPMHGQRLEKVHPTFSTLPAFHRIDMTEA